MNILYQMMEPCRIMNYIRRDDPYGGYEKKEWEEGVTFDAAIAKDSSTEAVVAQQEGVSEIFTVVTKKSFSLSYHEVFKRLSDGAIFRVTSNSKDSEAHPASTIPIAKVTAERWELT